MKRYEALVKKNSHSITTRVYIASEVDELLDEIEKLTLEYHRDEVLGLFEAIDQQRKEKRNEDHTKRSTD